MRFRAAVEQESVQILEHLLGESLERSAGGRLALPLSRSPKLNPA